MKQTIKAHEQSLSDVFSSSYLFNIPVYQRPYAWTTEQVDDLLDDLLAAQRHDASSPYFLGSIVLIKEEGEPPSEVVDGQQRLTTLAMILCALRDLSTDDDLKSEIDESIRQRARVMEGTSSKFRLELRDRDRQFFHQHIQRRGAVVELLDHQPNPGSDSQQGIIVNGERICRQLREVPEAERTALVEFIGTKCFLVVVTATDRDSAYRIFAVMNDRGLDLSPTDILKAEAIGGLSPDDQEEHGRRWEHIEEELGRDDFRNLFTHIRMIRMKSKMRQTLQADFQDHILKNVPGDKFIDTLLEPYADVYKMITMESPDFPKYQADLTKYLDYLRRLGNYGLGNVDWVPPAMEFALRNRDHSETLLGFIRDLERLAYGLYILRSNVNERIARYADVLRAIERDECLFKKTSSLQLDDSEKSSISRSLRGDIYLQKPLVRLVLQRLDSLLAEDHATYAPTTVTVEHVLPQNPRTGSEWMEWFPDEHERQGWTHRLANLVLLSRRKNSQASNWDFEEKKRRYFYRDNVSTFAITSQVIAETEWTPEVLERRQSDLVGALITEWRLA